jgi:hypothetical protein
MTAAALDGRDVDLACGLEQPQSRSGESVRRMHDFEFDAAEDADVTPANMAFQQMLSA